MTTPPGRQKRYQLRNLPPGCSCHQGKVSFHHYVFKDGKRIAKAATRYKAIIAAHDFLQDLENNSGQKTTT